MAPKKILVADDEALTLQVITFKLKQQGYAVHTAADGEAALHLAEFEKPDLIILDCMMPIIEGFEVLRRLKESPELKNIPVLMLTAKNKDHDIVAGLELGASDYIVKPFSPNELLARVRKALSAADPATKAA